MPGSFSVLEDLVAICGNELGHERAAELIAEAGTEAVQSVLGPDEVYGAEDPARATLQIWWKLWAALAAERSTLFVPDAHRISPYSPFALAFAYARAREPDGLQRLDWSARDRRALVAARRALGDVTELPGLDLSCVAWEYNDECLALRHLTQLPGLGNAGAYSFMTEAALRRQVLFDARCVRAWRADGIDLVALHLHEEMHYALSQEGAPADGVFARPLVLALQEPAAIIAELYAELLLAHERTPTLADVRRLTHQHLLGAMVRRVLNLLEPASAEEALRAAVSLAIGAIRSPDEQSLATELNQMFSLSRSSSRWLRTLT